MGTALGAWGVVYTAGRANAVVADTGAIDRMTSHVEAQRMLGDQGSYETALREYLVWLDRRRATHGPLFDQSAILTDMVLTHGRLALLAEGRGEVAVADSHFASALAQCPGAFNRLCSRESLRSALERLDSLVRHGDAEKK